MIKVFNSNVSIFKSLYNSKEEPYNMLLTDVYDRICYGNEPLREKIEAIRNPETDKAEKDKLKKSLLAIMFNGTFSKRADDDLIKHSGICVLDFDKYESEEVLQEERDRIQKDPFTLMCFRSPSGNGLKVLINIPESTKEDHKRRFKAYEKYIKSKYFDVANCNVSRVCFESYDPETYFNQSCEEFTEIAPEIGYEVKEIKDNEIILSDDFKACEYIVDKWNYSTDFSEGQRNTHLYVLASMLCSYGIPEEIAFNYVFNNVVIGDFKESECKHVFNSAYKRVDFGTKVFRDYDKENEIKNRIKRGEPTQKIAKETNTNEETVTQIKDNTKTTFETFWEIVTVKEGKKTREKIIFDAYRVNGFLQENGFYRYFNSDNNSAIFVKITENKVKIIDTEYIQTFMSNFANPVKSDKGSEAVFNEFFKNVSLICNRKSFISLIDDIDLKILQDTKDEVYLPYKNGVVKITKDKTSLIPYIDIDKYVWEGRIINRKYKESDNIDSDFRDFISKVSNNDQARIESLESTIGYLISNHKDKSHQKAIIFNDQEINENPNGGSGKSLLYSAVKKLKRGVQIDGKQFTPNKTFVYSQVNNETELICFDDVKKTFNFESLFSLITEGITVEKKGVDEIFIPFESSPKIVITTNYVIKGAGGSHSRRRHELEFFQYFNSNRSPEDEYGRKLFDDWNKADWEQFDNYMIHNVKSFLKNGLKSPKSINADVKRFIQETSMDFNDWVLEDDNLVIGAKYYNNQIIRDFVEEFKGYEKTLSNKKFISWIRIFAESNGYDFEKGRDNGGRFFKITEK